MPARRNNTVFLPVTDLRRAYDIGLGLGLGLGIGLGK